MQRPREQEDLLLSANTSQEATKKTETGLDVHMDRKEATCRSQIKRNSDQGLGKIIYHEGGETLAEDPQKAVTPSSPDDKVCMSSFGE